MLAQGFAGLQHRPVRAEHGHTTQAQLHELERHQTVVDPAKFDAAEFDHVDLDAAGGQPVEQALDHLVGLVVLEECGVHEVHADDAQRLLLQLRVLVEHAHMHDDLAGLVERVSLEAHAHPAVAFVAALVAAGDDRVGEGEERGGVAAGVTEAIDVEVQLVFEHRLQPALRDVAI